MGEDALDLPVAGVLHRPSAAPAQKLEEQGGEIFRAGPHHDLVRVDVDAPEVMEVAHDGRAQRRHAMGVGGGEEGAVFLAEDLPHQTGPGGEGEVLRVHGVGGKVIGKRGHLRRRGWGGRRGSGRGKGTLGLLGLDKEAPLGLGVHVALGQQLFIGVFHRDDPHLQVGGQGALGGEALPGAESAPFDLPADMAVDLFIQGLRSIWVQDRCEHGITSRSGGRSARSKFTLL